MGFDKQGKLTTQLNQCFIQSCTRFSCKHALISRGCGKKKTVPSVVFIVLLKPLLYVSVGRVMTVVSMATGVMLAQDDSSQAADESSQGADK